MTATFSSSCPRGTRLAGVVPAHQAPWWGPGIQALVSAQPRCWREPRRLVGDVIPHAVSRVVVVEGDRSLFLQRVGDVRSRLLPLGRRRHPRAVLVVARGRSECRSRRPSRRASGDMAQSGAGIALLWLPRFTRRSSPPVAPSVSTVLRTRVDLLPHSLAQPRHRARPISASTPLRPGARRSSICHERLPR